VYKATEALKCTMNACGECCKIVKDYAKFSIKLTATFTVTHAYH